MSAISYILEVYEPRSESDCICQYFAETPFPAISEGQILDFIYMDNKRIRVTKIVHLVWQNTEGNKDRVSFKTLIYTENADQG